MQRFNMLFVIVDPNTADDEGSIRTALFSGRFESAARCENAGRQELRSTYPGCTIRVVDAGSADDEIILD